MEGGGNPNIYPGCCVGWANLRVETPNLTLHDSTIEQSGYHGIYSASATLTITDSVIRHNSATGLSLTGTTATVTRSTISSNSGSGIYNATSSILVRAENNYWGHASGPYDPSDDRATGGLYNPDGTGDQVSNYVDYAPWLGTDPHLTLSGIVYNVGNYALIAGASVTLGTYTTTTNSNGYYTLRDIAGGNYTMMVSKSGYFDYRATFNLTTLMTRDVALTAQSDTCTNGGLTGDIRDALTNRGLSGAAVSLSNGFFTVTGDGGHYAFPSIPTGSYTMSVSKASYSSYAQSVSICGDSTQNIPLTKPATVYGSRTPSGYGPDPVNTATGNYIYQKVDVVLPGRGMALHFERNYNAQDSVDGPLGFGWGHTYQAQLTVNDDAIVTIRWGDGKTETYTPDGAGGFTPQYGVFDTLTAPGDGAHTLKRKDLTSYTFDASGRLASIIDKNGNTISLTYTGNTLTQITDTVGRVLALVYDGNNRITRLTDSIGRTVQFAYDGNGDLVAATDMNGKTTTYTYDAQHQILTVVDPRGNTVVTNTYDDQRRVVTSQRDAKGGQTTYTYDTENHKTTIGDALSNTTIHFHDSLLRLIQEIDGLGKSAFYTYDTAGNRTQVQDKNGRVTAYTYDARGNVLTKKDALGNITTITYDATNTPLTSTDALGNITTYEYDAHSNLTQTTDALGHVTTVTYDAFGQPLTVTDARGNIRVIQLSRLGRKRSRFPWERGRLARSGSRRDACAPRHMPRQNRKLNGPEATSPPMPTTLRGISSR